MKRIIISLTICLFHGTIDAQVDINSIDSLKNEVTRQVSEIDNQTLNKTLLDSHGYRIGDENSINEWLSVLYFDTSGVLRKSKLMYYYVGDVGSYLRYYGDSGVAIYSIYESFSGMNSGYSVLRYLDNSGELLFVDFLNRDDDRGGQIIEHITRLGGYGLSMPQIDGENYDKVMNIDDLRDEIKQIFDIDSLYMPKNTTPVRFVRPQKGDRTFVCQNNVPIYPRISGFAEPVCELSIGHEVTVLGITDKWYNVRYNDMEGYVSKESLAPIEQIITE